jgi:hypothetical protein
MIIVRVLVTKEAEVLAKLVDELLGHLDVKDATLGQGDAALLDNLGRVKGEWEGVTHPWIVPGPRGAIHALPTA